MRGSKGIIPTASAGPKGSTRFNRNLKSRFPGFRAENQLPCGGGEHFGGQHEEPCKGRDDAAIYNFLISKAMGSLGFARHDHHLDFSATYLSRSHGGSCGRWRGRCGIKPFQAGGNLRLFGQTKFDPFSQRRQFLHFFHEKKIRVG